MRATQAARPAALAKPDVSPGVNASVNANEVGLDDARVGHGHADSVGDQSVAHDWRSVPNRGEHHHAYPSQLAHHVAHWHANHEHANHEHADHEHPQHGHPQRHGGGAASRDAQSLRGGNPFPVVGRARDGGPVGGKRVDDGRERA